MTLRFGDCKDKELNNERIRKMIRDIRIDLGKKVGNKPELFGVILDSLMLSSDVVRKIVYDIVELKREVPKDFNAVLSLRLTAEIVPSDSKEERVQKLLDYYMCDDLEELKSCLKDDDISLEDLLSPRSDLATSVADLIANKVLSVWKQFISEQGNKLSEYIPHSDEVIRMYDLMSKQLPLKKYLVDRLDKYNQSFTNEQQVYAIADFSALTLNNFISDVGHSYMSEEDKQQVADKAKSCRIRMKENTYKETHKKIDMKEALFAFDEASNPSSTSLDTLQKLPFWGNFERWKKLLEEGILFAADISHVDPVENNAMKEIIVGSERLYK